jgi:hypothetical protein
MDHFVIDNWREKCEKLMMKLKFSHENIDFWVNVVPVGKNDARIYIGTKHKAIMKCKIFYPTYYKDSKTLKIYFDGTPNSVLVKDCANVCWSTDTFEFDILIEKLKIIDYFSKI